jgi:hypothetical protein
VSIRRSSLRTNISLLLVCLFGSLHAQRAYNSSPLSISANDITLLADSMQPADSALENFQFYRPSFFMQDLGNVASPYRLRYIEKPDATGFNTGWFRPDLYFHHARQARYYKAILPYTLAGYTSGQRPSNGLDFLQIVSLMHTQNWGKLFNIGVDIDAFRCNGFSTNAEARTGSGQLFAWFHTPNFRYQVLGNAVFNSASNNINGGIFSDSIYENTSGLTKEDRGLLSDSSFYKYRGREYFLKQFYRFGKETVSTQTHAVKRDSLRIDTIRNIETRFQLSHEILFTNDAWSYTDNVKPSAGFYKNYYFDSLHTHDTLHQRKLSNLVEVTIRPLSQAMISVGFENRLHWINNQGQSFIMNEDLARAAYRQQVFRKDSGLYSFINANAVYYLFNTYHEFSSGDYNINARLDLNGRRFVSWLGAGANAQSPLLREIYFPGNHFYWYNASLSKEQTDFMEATLKWLPFHSELTAYIASINHRKYFDNAPDLALQESGTFTYSSIRWRQKLRFHSITWLHDLYLQRSGDQSALPVPEVLFHGTLMYDEQWFNKALHIQFGVSMDYFSKYYAPAFMPSLNVFYTQHERKIGEYPQFDAFLNMQIQRVRLFFLSEHFNQDMPGISSAAYSTLHYPLARRSFRFGISWSFYD